MIFPSLIFLHRVDGLMFALAPVTTEIIENCFSCVAHRATPLDRASWKITQYRGHGVCLPGIGRFAG